MGVFASRCCANSALRPGKIAEIRRHEAIVSHHRVNTARDRPHLQMAKQHGRASAPSAQPVTNIGSPANSCM